jgi:hypothetical protein
MDVSVPLLFIITYPRTASNLFMRMLAMPGQPNAIAAESGCYFFMPAIRHMREKGLIGRHHEEWTKHERSELEHVYQACSENLQCLMLSDKTVVVKEHAPFLVSPTAQLKYLHGREGDIERPWKLRIPDMYDVDLPELPIVYSVRRLSCRVVSDLSNPSSCAGFPIILSSYALFPRRGYRKDA